ncbi:sporulation control protein Spo0M [Vibrio azureus]|uniref:Sporulation-control protein n=1 Tax=Vibrio azureus NBRC 104587 TaxID=1219077 RepID=U3AQD4_9VIBR|nr:sporulation protein [Vibrio azureus]AUI84956.1 sporulation control protein Spo0M [Vibrio azureus]GAD75975.1 sporulation-control protein [Vibrio azureus NBRC 104587]
MSFLKKTLASFGIGSAKVDSILHQDVLYPGQTIDVSIHVYGGATQQPIDNIELKLCCRYIAEAPDDRGARHTQRSRRIAQTHVLAQWTLPYGFTIHPGEDRVFDITLEVPWNTPITIGDAKVWLETGLDISMALDPTDKDILTVRPDPVMDAILSALESQGLRIRQVECEEVKGFALPFVQEFEMVPVDGPYHGMWRELEFVAHRDETALGLWFEVDRARNGHRGMLASLLGGGKLKRQLNIPIGTKPEQAGCLVLDYLAQTMVYQEA